jgi:hypothetical protein
MLGTMGLPIQVRQSERKSRMKAVCKFYFCILLFLITARCAAVHDVVLESKDIQFFKVDEPPGGQYIRLRISGLAFKSAVSVNKIVKHC